MGDNLKEEEFYDKAFEKSSQQATDRARLREGKLQVDDQRPREVLCATADLWLIPAERDPVAQGTTRMGE